MIKEREKKMNTIQIHKDGKATLAMVMLPIGAYYEDNRIKGISHFIEHLCFKGTKHRKRNEIDLAIERYGGDINAFTDWEMTAYWAKIANQYKDIAIDVIEDLATNPIFPSEEIDKEREVILQELRMYRDIPADDIYNIVNKIYYPQDSGFHYSIIGTEDSLKNIDRTEILNFYKKHYKTPISIIIGDVEDYVDINYKRPILSRSFSTHSQKKRIIETRKDIEQTNMLIKSDVYLSDYSNLEKEILLDLLSELYNNMSGRLFSKVREEHNLVYRIRFDCEQYSNGLITWEVSLGLDKSKIDKAYDLIIKELSRPITKQELAIITTKVIGAQALKTESLSYLVENVAHSIRNDIDWKEYLFNFEHKVIEYRTRLQIFLDKMNFKENIMVAIVPEK